jgi:preprotein translocase subunit YajC
MPGADAAGAGGLGSLGGMLIPFIVIMGAMYLLMILPQKRKEKKKKEMVNAVKKGDEIVSIGGISGKVVNVKDDQVTLETGAEKTKIALKKWAIQDVKKPLEA